MKRIVSIFLICLLLIITCFYLTGCGCEHRWTEISNTATCGENGTITYKCTICGKTRTKFSSSTGKHQLDYSTGIKVDPKKYEKGYTNYTCKICGKQVKGSETRSLMDEAKYGLEKIIEKLKSILIDPESLIYDAECYSSYQWDKSKGEWAGIFLYKIHYNAKNRFGGYVGYEYKYYCWNSSAYHGISTYDEDNYNTYKCNYYFSK